METAEQLAKRTAEAKRFQLLHILRLLETASRRYADGSDKDAGYVLAMCERARIVLSNNE